MYTSSDDGSGGSKRDAIVLDVKTPIQGTTQVVTNTTVEYSERSTTTALTRLRDEGV